MTDLRIDSAAEGAFTSQIDDYSVEAATTSGAGESKESSWQNAYWSEDYGYYLKIPEFKRAIDTKALWTVGGGFEADEPTTLLLMNIKGNGKDSFNSILKNMIKCKTISMDSFAEIIRDENDVLINLKPLDPSSVVIVQNEKGRIIRYEQRSKTKKDKREFEPHEIFHLSHERVADEIHGTRIISSLKWLIDARNEAMVDWRRVLHRCVDPLWIFHLDTDDTTEVGAFKTKMDSARANGENMYIPKGTVEPELISTSINATLNPIAWLEQLNDRFFQAVNVPQIIIGNAKEFTDASGKIVYLSYEQSVKDEQLYIEEQVLGQLNMEIKLTFPATLQTDLISSREKDSKLAAAQPNDMIEEMEGWK